MGANKSSRRRRKRRKWEAKGTGKSGKVFGNKMLKNGIGWVFGQKKNQISCKEKEKQCQECKGKGIEEKEKEIKKKIEEKIGEEIGKEIREEIEERKKKKKK